MELPVKIFQQDFKTLQVIQVACSWISQALLFLLVQERSTWAKSISTVHYSRVLQDICEIVVSFFGGGGKRIRT